MNPQLTQLVKELGEAINKSLSYSDPIAEVVARIKKAGYEVFMVLEATIGVNKLGAPDSEKTSIVSTWRSGQSHR